MLETAAQTSESRGFLADHGRPLNFCLMFLVNAAVVIYFVYATVHWYNSGNEQYNWCNGYGLLILLVAFVYGGILCHLLSKSAPGKACATCWTSISDSAKSVRETKYGFVVYILMVVAIVVFLVIDTANSRERLQSGVGVVVLFAIGWLFSKHPTRVNWGPVMSGLILQFLFGILTLRWSVGRAILQCVADKAEAFLNCAKSGASFVFGNQLVDDGVFAFSALPVIFYFSFIIQILYYLGVMQWVILNMGRVLQALMGTTICESVICAANVFVGMSESPLIVKPYLNKLTSSELHTVMASGFATVSGTVMAAYIKFGADPAHLITATLMAAPAALSYTKLFFPETEKVVVLPENIKLTKSEDSSLMDAASKGATAGIPLVLGIVANIVAFVAFVTLINGLLSWIGMLVGNDELSFEFILSRIFMPLSWIIGVPWDQCEDVGTLIGLKTAVNEFVAYERLGEFKKQGRIFGRTEAIVTFAICGFANPGAMGITLSMLSSLAPDKKEIISAAIFRAFVAGSAVTFLTASTAGMLIPDDYYHSPTSRPPALNATVW
ncbi:concentrative nucleoside transporter 2 [Xylocopa sonorina]|uniref:concentrative nucleoside transporter 2 n=1 Tax=Xylocopa sonorina TaxID=1818115 RepID=UPI00403AD24E